MKVSLGNNLNLLFGDAYSALYGNSTYDPHWQRYFYMRELILNGTEASIIAYFDDDLLITNFSVRIENFFRLVANPEKIHLIISRDAWVNDFKYLLNSGSMLLRNSEESLSFINYCRTKK